MRAFSVHISGFIGVLTFVKHLWTNASVEQTVFVSLAVGVGIYLVLTIGESVIEMILKQPAKTGPEEAKVKDEQVGQNSAGSSMPKTA